MIKNLLVFLALTLAAAAQSTPTYQLEVPPVGTTPYSSIIFQDFTTIENLLNGTAQAVGFSALTGTFGSGGGLMTMSPQAPPSSGNIILGQVGCFTDVALLIWRCQDSSGNDISGTYFWQVNGTNLLATDTINLSNSVPAAPINGINIQFATSKTGNIDSISGAVVGDGNATHFLNGQGGFTAPAGGGWNSLTAGTNSNPGTFSASGNSWDFTGSTIFKVRSVAGLTASASGDIGENPSTGNWHIWDGIDALIVAASAGGTFTIGDCLQVGSFTPFRVVDTGNPCGGSGSGTLLNNVGPQAAITGTASPVNVYSFSIPGSTMNSTSCIKATVGFQHSTGTASTTYTWSYGGTTLTSTASVGVGKATSGFVVCNNNATNVQYMYAFMDSLMGTSIYTAPQNATSTVDTTAAQTLSFQFNTPATDKVTPLLWIVENVRH